MNRFSLLYEPRAVAYGEKRARREREGGEGARLNELEYTEKIEWK